jgi:putative phosphoribosyl transferase
MRRYSNRREAGAELAGHLAHHVGSDPLVLGIPRGGVVVAAEVASALDGSLDVVVARKIGAPWSPELALGAVAPDGVPLIDREMAARLGVFEDELRPETERQLEELRRREELYRGGRPLDIEERVVIVVDDGVATGATLRSVIGYVDRQGARFLSCAVPVGPPSTIGLIAIEVDEVVCPLQPPRFRAVGDWYRDFSQTTDAEVLSLLEAGRSG